MLRPTELRLQLLTSSQATTNHSRGKQTAGKRFVDSRRDPLVHISTPRQTPAGSCAHPRRGYRPSERNHRSARDTHNSRVEHRGASNGRRRHACGMCGELRSRLVGPAGSFRHRAVYSVGAALARGTPSVIECVRLRSVVISSKRLHWRNGPQPRLGASILRVADHTPGARMKNRAAPFVIRWRRRQEFGFFDFFRVLSSRSGGAGIRSSRYFCARFTLSRRNEPYSDSSRVPAANSRTACAASSSLATKR